MKRFLNGKIATVIILLATFVLAGVAIFTAIRLYQLRLTSVAPNVPSSLPKAAGNACSLSFTLTTSTPTPPAGHCEPVTGAYWCSNATAKNTVLTVDHDVTNWNDCLSWCNQNMTAAAPLCQYNGDSPRNCWVKSPPTGGIDACIWLPKMPMGSCFQGSGTPTPTPTGTPTVTPTPTPTPTSTPNTCNGTCGSNSNCNSDLVCSGGFCRNPNCTGNTNCVCSTATPTPTPTGTLGPTPTPTAPALPSSGTDWPSMLGIIVGAATIIGSLVLAL